MTRRAVTEVLRREARRRPLLVVMDDLHWADQSSVELLESLLRLVAEERLLFLIAARPGWADSAARVRERARVRARRAQSGAGARAARRRRRCAAWCATCSAAATSRTRRAR